ncbi:hypothetical protein GIB67_034786 [Kingdonia uniflora]|uniref:Uncharacterized protein n=1 Tax=Kingdonia uniflora TaxID=39325 RepID=A0A7J7ME78_9MAGN|nr:hypothetical protein GIB67_034786 [Kingdonia uniflora]
MVPVIYDDWRHVPLERKDLIWEAIKQRFTLDAENRSYCMSTVGRLWRSHKTRLRRIIDCCKKQEIQEYEVKTSLPYTGTRRGYARLENDMKMKSAKPSSVVRVDVWMKTHTKELPLIATDMIFNGITLMIAEGVFGKMNVPDFYPSTLFVHMPKDRTRMCLISENMKALRQKGIHVAEIKCSEFSLTPNLLCRVPGLSQSISQGLFELIHEKGFIDQNTYMRNDGHATHWKEALKERKTLLSETNELIPHIQDELNLVFAYHDIHLTNL